MVTMRARLKFANTVLITSQFGPCIPAVQISKKRISFSSNYTNIGYSRSCSHLLLFQRRQIHLQHFTNTKDIITNTQWNKYEGQSEDLPVDPLTASKYLTELINNGRHDEAVAKFEQLCRSKVVNNVTWNTWLTYIGKHYELEKLIGEYRKMLSMGIRPSFITYSILILNSCKKGNIELALKLLSQMTKRWKPNAAIYNAFIKAYMDAHDLPKAHNFYLKMQHEGGVPDSSTRKLLLNLFVSLGDATSVKKIAQEVLNSETPQLQTMVALIRACIIIGEHQLARQGLRSLISTGKLTDAKSLFTPFITAAVEHDQLDMLTLCLAILKNKFQTQPEEHLLIDILNFYVKHGKITQSIDILLMIEGFQWTVQLATKFIASVTFILQQKGLTSLENIQPILKEMDMFNQDQKGEDGMATLRSRSFNQFREIITKLQTMQELVGE